MKTVKHITDLTPEERDGIFLARKFAVSAFIPMPGPVIVQTAEGDSYHEFDYAEYLLAIGNNGDVWPVSKEFYDKNYAPISAEEQVEKLPEFLKAIEES